MVIIAQAIKICKTSKSHQTPCCMRSASQSLIPAILPLRNAFVGSRSPVISDSSRNKLRKFWQMNVSKKATSYACPLRCFDYLSFYSQTFEEEIWAASVGFIPPTVAAASTTTFGLFSFIHLRTAESSSRFSSCRWCEELSPLAGSRSRCA